MPTFEVDDSVDITMWSKTGTVVDVLGSRTYRVECEGEFLTFDATELTAAT